MQRCFFILFTILISQITFAQKIDSVAALSSNIFESSGLVFIEGKLYTHTDSSGEAALYEIDTNTALINKTVYIQNAVNIDWEDITQDDDYIYIADFGNNQGNRTNLSILKLVKTDFLNASNLDSLMIEKIEFSYEDQTNFNSANQNTAFDAEALIAFEDSLYIFTKNWISQETTLYALPKTAGSFSAHKINSYDVDGLVTGATIHPSKQKITLCGYTKLGSSFIFEMKNFNSSNFFEAENQRYSISPFGSVQIEGICATKEKQCFLSSEMFFTLPAYLHKWTDTTYLPIDTLQPADTTMGLNSLKQRLKLFPNPSNDFLNLENDFNEIIIFDIKGTKVSAQFSKPINIKKLDKGIYFLVFKNEENIQQSIQFEKR